MGGIGKTNRFERNNRDRAFFSFALIPEISFERALKTAFSFCSALAIEETAIMNIANIFS